jgi:MATE family multidrug resistance protein
MIATWFVVDPAVIALAVQLLIVAGVFQLVDGTQAIGASVLRAVSDVRWPLAITLTAYWGIALPVGYALGVLGPLGAVGVWVGIASGLAVAAILLPWRFARLTRAD